MSKIKIKNIDCPTESSLVDSFIYDLDSRILEVRLYNSSRNAVIPYYYESASSRIFERFANAGSYGTHYNAYIKSNMSERSYSEVGEEPQASEKLKTGPEEFLSKIEEVSPILMKAEPELMEAIRRRKDDKNIFYTEDKMPALYTLEMRSRLISEALRIMQENNLDEDLIRECAEIGEEMTTTFKQHTLVNYI
jgi:hypothetical protein